jgi:hypothetical protein
MTFTWSPASPSSSRYGPTATERVWFSIVLQDPALFHLLLYSSAVFNDQFSGTESLRVEKLTHMSKAIHLLNVRLQGPCIDVSNGTIIAIAYLADIAVRSFIQDRTNIILICASGIDGAIRCLEDPYGRVAKDRQDEGGFSRFK